METEVPDQNITETKVGRKLSDLTTKRAILLMFTVMISIPFFDYTTYWTVTTSYDTGLSLLYNHY
jgi:hypothetical protein